MELEEIKEVTSKFPPLAYYCLDGKVKPVVEFLLDLGVTKSDITASIRKWPQPCGVSLSEHLIPTVTLLEDLSVDKKQLGKVIQQEAYEGKLSNVESATITLFQTVIWTRF